MYIPLKIMSTILMGILKKGHIRRFYTNKQTKRRCNEEVYVG